MLSRATLDAARARRLAGELPEPLIAENPAGLAPRTSALRIAAGLYMTLAEPNAEEHLRDIGCIDDETIAQAVAQRATCLEYLGGRGFLGADGELLPQLRGLVGVCTGWHCGLQQWLDSLGYLHMGVAAGVLKHRRRGDALYETMRGRVVYVWHDANGDIAYLSGRAVPAMAERCRLLDRDGDIIKSHALPIHDPVGKGHDFGVQRPDVPFGLAAARRIHRRTGRPFIIHEGEADALTGLLHDIPAVATGGTSRTKADVLRRTLPSVRDAIVMFDADADDRAEKLAREVGCRWISASKVK